MVRCEDLEPGKRYTLSLDDCCIVGTITATFLRLDEDADVLHFDIGQISTWQGIKFYEEL